MGKGAHAWGQLYETTCVDCGIRCYAAPAYFNSSRCETCSIRYHGCMYPVQRVLGVRPRPVGPNPGALPPDARAGRGWREAHNFRRDVVKGPPLVIEPARPAREDEMPAECRRMRQAITDVGGRSYAARAVGEDRETGALVESLTLRFSVRGALGYAAWWNRRAKGGVLIGLTVMGVRPIAGIMAWIESTPWPVPTHTCVACGREGLRRKADGSLYAHKRAHGDRRGESCNAGL